MIALESFHPSVRDWFLKRFTAPTEPQARAWPAIKRREHTLIAAPTGSGKTTYMKTLCGLIPPKERIITIEDTRELFLPHANKVHLLYSTQGVAKVDPTAPRPSTLLDCAAEMPEFDPITGKYAECCRSITARA